ncbi:MAG TPA: hypothetical protein PKE45_00640 [Caldilineaceae bacterium]|nr:hypothetical protein [Caldilineaceae bacterium]
MLQPTRESTHQSSPSTVRENPPGHTRPGRMITGVVSLWCSLGAWWQSVARLLSIQRTRPLALQPCRVTTVQAVAYRRRKSQPWE